MHIRLRTTIALALTGAAALALFPSTPASADDQTVTLTVPNGTLTINAQASADLGSANNLLAGSTATGPLGNVVVTDLRNATLGWVASVSGTDFTKAGGGSIAKANAAANAVGALVSSTGLAVSGGFVGAAASLANSGGPLGTAVALGSNTATFNPSMSVVVPVDTPAGAYTSTVTFTVV